MMICVHHGCGREREGSKDLYCLVHAAEFGKILAMPANIYRCMAIEEFYDRVNPNYSASLPDISTSPKITFDARDMRSWSKPVAKAKSVPKRTNTFGAITKKAEPTETFSLAGMINEEVASLNRGQ